MEFIEIWKYVYLRLILKDKGGNRKIEGLTECSKPSSYLLTELEASYSFLHPFPLLGETDFRKNAIWGNG